MRSPFCRGLRPVLRNASLTCLVTTDRSVSVALPSGPPWGRCKDSNAAQFRPAGGGGARAALRLGSSTPPVSLAHPVPVTEPRPHAHSQARQRASPLAALPLAPAPLPGALQPPPPPRRQAQGGHRRRAAQARAQHPAVHVPRLPARARRAAGGAGAAGSGGTRCGRRPHGVAGAAAAQVGHVPARPALPRFPATLPAPEPPGAISINGLLPPPGTPLVLLCSYSGCALCTQASQPAAAPQMAVPRPVTRSRRRS